jgi:hypothetical protein
MSGFFWLIERRGSLAPFERIRGLEKRTAVRSDDLGALVGRQGLGKVRECLFHGFLMSVRQLGARALAPGHTSVHT